MPFGGTRKTSPGRQFLHLVAGAVALPTVLPVDDRAPVMLANVHNRNIGEAFSKFDILSFQLVERGQACRDFMQTAGSMRAPTASPDAVMPQFVRDGPDVSNIPDASLSIAVFPPCGTGGRANRQAYRRRIAEPRALAVRSLAAFRNGFTAYPARRPTRRPRTGRGNDAQACQRRAIDQCPPNTRVWIGSSRT
jgi:hypothetical protein